MNTSAPPELCDVQGLAKYGYGKLTEACYLLLRIQDAGGARSWIASALSANWVSTAEYREPPPERALQIAFTPTGLSALGLPDRLLAGFSTEFLTGMAGNANRSRRLGDTGWSDPADWFWGGPERAPDLVVILFAQKDLSGWTREIQQAPWAQAFETLQHLHTTDMKGHEPFGFADGISQPAFDWDRKLAAAGDTVAFTNEVALGELLLGYPNEYGKYTDRPLLESIDDPADDLLTAEDHAASKDLGRNGTYLVMRHLEQDVRRFWQYLAKVAGSNPEDRYRLGAAMVGRALDGTPLIAGSGKNAFTFDQDPTGTKCPLGAHIRRANPRNADLFGHPSDAIARLLSLFGLPRPKLRDDLVASTRFHRILRRGREYGKDLSPDEALMGVESGEEPRGLYFVCLGANIARQFEFVQNAWLMSTKFDGLTEESDPLLGNRGAVGNCPATDKFSIPREGKVARRLTGIPQFIRVRGGAYFFLPGLRALRYLAR